MPTRAELFATAEPLVVRAARAVGLTPRSRDWDDCVQELKLQLWRATERFDVKRGVPFRGFASWVLRGAARNFLEAQARPPHREHVDDIDTQPVGCSSEDAVIEGIDRSNAIRLVRAVAEHAVGKMTPAVAEVAKNTILRDESALSMARRTGRNAKTLDHHRATGMRMLTAACREIFT